MASAATFDWGALPDDMQRKVLGHCDWDTANNLQLTSKANQDLVSQATELIEVQRYCEKQLVAAARGTILDLTIWRGVDRNDAMFDSIPLEKVRTVTMYRSTSEDIAWLAAQSIPRCIRLNIRTYGAQRDANGRLNIRIEPGAFDAWTSLRTLKVSNVSRMYRQHPENSLEVPVIPPQLQTFKVKFDGLLNDRVVPPPARELPLELQFLRLQCYRPSMRILQGMSRLHTLIIKTMLPSLVPHFVFDDGPAIEHPLPALRNLRLSASCVPFIPMLVGDAGQLDSLVIDVDDGDVTICIDSLPPVVRRLAIVDIERERRVRLQCASIDSFMRWIRQVDFKYITTRGIVTSAAEEAVTVVPRDCRGSFSLFTLRRPHPVVHMVLLTSRPRPYPLHGAPIYVSFIRSLLRSFSNLLECDDLMVWDSDNYVFSAVVVDPTTL